MCEYCLFFFFFGGEKKKKKKIKKKNPYKSAVYIVRGWRSFYNDRRKKFRACVSHFDGFFFSFSFDRLRGWWCGYCDCESVQSVGNSVVVIVTSAAGDSAGSSSKKKEVAFVEMKKGRGLKREGELRMQLRWD